MALSEEDGSVHAMLQSSEINSRRRFQLSSLDHHITDYFTSEASRLLTFGSWDRLHPINPTALASTGCFYLLQGDRVQCFSCGIIIDNWRIGDDPKTVHCNAMLSCPFMNNQVNDIPIEDTEERSKIVKTLQATHKAPGEVFKSEERRLLSFRNCDIEKIKKWQKFAKDGFFLVQLTPMVLQCFACEGRISATEEIEAAVNHHNLYPDCPFLARKPVGNRQMGSLWKTEVVNFLTQSSQQYTEDAAEEVQYSENLTVQVEGN